MAREKNTGLFLKGGKEIMSIFIDNYNGTFKGTFKGMLMCHMVADSDKELDKMAYKVGIEIKWKQEDHYDVCLSKKKLAIKYGVKEVTTFMLSKMIYLKRMRKKWGIKSKCLDYDYNNLKRDNGYFEQEKQRIRIKGEING
jgi:hypothetical protein